MAYHHGEEHQQHNHHGGHNHTHGAVDPSIAGSEASRVRMTDAPTYTTRALGPDTWDDFATLVEANNGVWGGCWCMGFHPEGLDRENASTATPSGPTSSGEPSTKCSSLRKTTAWAGASTEPPRSCPTSRTPKAYVKDLGSLPDWRIGCIFTDKSHRGQGVTRAAVTAAMTAIKEAGGGIVEA